jgi:hypothetical protein
MTLKSRHRRIHRTAMIWLAAMAAVSEAFGTG